jgi:C_GCAxxG_C_C family probable redox protein
MNGKAYFQTVAPQWEQMRQAFFSDELRETALNAAGVEPGKVAADIGAGSGFISRGLAEKGVRVIAVDRSRAMLEQLRPAVPTAEVRVGEAEHLPLEDGEVDYVFANMFLHHVADPAKALKEMTRILRPGGRLVLTDLDQHTHEFLRVEHHDKWMGFDREQVAGWMTAAGLTQVSVDCARQNCCASSQDGSDTAAVSIFLASGVNAGHRGRASGIASAADTTEDQVSARSAALFESGMYCAESILLAVADVHGLKDASIPRIATGFCGGISRTDGMCGALAGGIMALGLLTGRSAPQDSKTQCYALVDAFIGRFSREFGSTRCTDLLGCNLSTIEGSLCFQEKGLMEEVCAPVTRRAAGLVEEVFGLREKIRHPRL